MLVICPVHSQPKLEKSDKGSSDPCHGPNWRSSPLKKFPAQGLWITAKRELSFREVRPWA